MVQDQAPINQKMYRLPETQREVINEQLKEMLANDARRTNEQKPMEFAPVGSPQKSGTRWREKVESGRRFP